MLYPLRMAAPERRVHPRQRRGLLPLHEDDHAAQAARRAARHALRGAGARGDRRSARACRSSAWSRSAERSAARRRSELARRCAGPTQATASSSRDARARPRATSSKVTASSAAIAASGSMLLAEDDRLVWRRGARPRRCSRTRARAGRPAYARARSTSSSVGPVAAQLVDDLAHPRVGLDALARVEARRRAAGSATSAKAWSMRPDRVAEAALLADLVEQPRAHRAAEQRRVDRERGALAASPTSIVGPVDHAQVRLVGVALLDQRLRRERPAPARRARAPAAPGSARSSSCSSSSGGQVVGVADEERAAARPAPAPLAEGDDPLAA